MEKWMPFLQRTPPTRSGTSEVPELIFRGWTRQRGGNSTGTTVTSKKKAALCQQGMAAT